MIFVWLLLTVLTQVKSDCSQCSTTNRQLHNAQNKILQNNVYKQTTVANHVICGRDCSMDKECKSFSFNDCKKVCELNTADRAEHPEDFLSDQESVYFDSDKNTPHYSVPDSSFIRYKNCMEILQAGNRESGIYTIYLNGSDCGLMVYCDMETAGGGWIVVQRRFDGSVEFFTRNWTDYKSGFGNVSGELWLGNDNLVALTNDMTHGPWMMRLDLGRNTGAKAHVTYKYFKVLGDQYTLHIGGFDEDNSTVRDSLSSHNGSRFSTFDRDNDERSDVFYAQQTGGWWYKDWMTCRINGEYFPLPGIGWVGWTTARLDKSNMKIR